MCDFPRRASVNSGVYSFSVKKKGAGFDLADHDHFFWHVLATDVDFRAGWENVCFGLGPKLGTIGAGPHLPRL